MCAAYQVYVQSHWRFKVRGRVWGLLVQAAALLGCVKMLMDEPSVCTARL